MSKLHPTPHILRTAYEYLRSTPPFRTLRLPDADEVEMHVIRSRGYQGQCITSGGQHIIQVSAAKICRTQSLLEVMAHEMVHVYCHPRGEIGHGRAFQRLAKRVCEIHGFDPKLF